MRRQSIQMVLRGLGAGAVPLLFIFVGNPRISLDQILLATPVAFGLAATYLGQKLQMPALSLFSAAVVGAFLNAFAFSLSTPLAGLRPDTVSILCLLLCAAAVALSFVNKQWLTFLPAFPQALGILILFALVPRIIPDRTWLILAWSWRAAPPWLSFINFTAIAALGTLLFQAFREERPAVQPLLFLTMLLFLLVMDEIAIKQVLSQESPWIRPELFVSLPFLCGLSALLYGELHLYWQRIYTDELTGVLNRRALNERLWRLRPHYTVAMVDIDHFKQFNDTYGHEQGDTVLRFVASHFANPPHGTTYRYGGEEFCIVFHNISAPHAARLLNDLRETLAKKTFHIRAPKQVRQLTSRKDRRGAGKAAKVHITVSIGIADPQADTQTTDDVLKAADTALYQAKHRGRNQVVDANAPKTSAAAA